MNNILINIEIIILPIELGLGDKTLQIEKVNLICLEIIFLMLILLELIMILPNCIMETELQHLFVIKQMILLFLII